MISLSVYLKASGYYHCLTFSIKVLAHGGMNSGGVDNGWWTQEEISLLKSRLTAR